MPLPTETEGTKSGSSEEIVTDYRQPIRDVEYRLIRY